MAPRAGRTGYPKRTPRAREGYGAIPARGRQVRWIVDNGGFFDLDHERNGAAAALIFAFVHGDVDIVGRAVIS